jgi:hypothetical protein
MKKAAWSGRRITSMKTQPIRLTTPYPSVKKMAKTLGASKSEIAEAKRLVHVFVVKKTSSRFGARREASKKAAR